MNTNIDRAAEILETLHAQDQLEGDGVVGCFDAAAAAQALADAGHLTPDPQIIRTVDKLEALDRMTVLMHADDGHPLTLGWHWFDEEGNLWPESEEDLPAVVVATGAQVRAARTALQEATE